MRVGILQPAAFPGSPTLLALRRIASDRFFGAVETTSAGPTAAHPAAELLGVAGLEVDVDAAAALHARGASLCSLDHSARLAAMDLVRAAVDEAHLLGAIRLNLISGHDPGAADRADACSALVDSILELYEAAGSLELGLKMADRAVDKRFLIGPTHDGVDVARRVRARRPGFGLVLNLAHLPLLGEDPATAVRDAAPYLARVHIGNCIKAHGDTHPRFAVAGGENGVAELGCFLRALIEVGYLARGSQNVVAFEVRPGAGDDPLDVIAESKRTLCEAWASV
jgi:sugar phosphate isomerase/epimerase